MTTPVFALLAGILSQAEDTKVLFEKESLYHYIRVTEEHGIRYLQFRRVGTEYEESALCVADPLKLEMAYYGYMMAAIAHHPDPRRVLFVGLGGGTLPMAIAHYFPKTHIDNVELDPEVAFAAKKYFGFKEGPRMKLYIRDARVQIRKFIREKKTYDLILLDAFRGGYIPYHLTTREFMEQLKAILAEDGIVVSNLRPGFESYHYHRRTMAAVFRNQWSCGEGSNQIVVADMRKQPIQESELLKAAKRLQAEKKFKTDIVPIVTGGQAGGDYETKGDILTDDYAPTDVLRGIPRE